MFCSSTETIFCFALFLLFFSKADKHFSIFLKLFDMYFDFFNDPIPWIMHNVRNSIRRYAWLSVPRNRNDMGGVHQVAGIDIEATTALLRKKQKGKGTVLSRMERGTLAFFIAGGHRTQERMARGKLAECDSPLCPYCGEEEESVRHIIWKCHRWECCRGPLRQVFNEE